VSHWKTIVSEERSGTPVDWLRESDSSIIELFCSCPVQVAASRFAARHRHPGHLDSYRTDADVLNWMSHYQKGLPLGLGELITVDASDQLDFDELQVQISDILDVST